MNYEILARAQRIYEINWMNADGGLANRFIIEASFNIFRISLASFVLCARIPLHIIWACYFDFFFFHIL